MAVYGIDLGTTYSCIASIDQVGRAEVHRNSEGSDTTPSVIFFETPDNVVVGQYAKDSAVLKPGLVISRIKRDMGQDARRTLHGKPYSPEEISAFVLRKLAKDAQVATGETVSDVVITVPAYFGAAERDATRKAGGVAGLNVIDIISEPIAAAITYGVLKPEQDCHILVYDLGGGTFDTTVMTLRGGNIEVVCTDGDHDLGGANWDDTLVQYLADASSSEHPDVSAPLDSDETEQDLRNIAEDAQEDPVHPDQAHRPRDARGARGRGRAHPGGVRVAHPGPAGAHPEHHPPDRGDGAGEGGRLLPATWSWSAACPGCPRWPRPCRRSSA